MTLTKRQKRVLEEIRSYRNLDTSKVADLKPGIWKQRKILVALVVAAAFLGPPLGAWWAPIFMLGMITGICLSDVADAYSIREFWPVHTTLLDWQRIDELLAGNRGPQQEGGVNSRSLHPNN